MNRRKLLLDAGLLGVAAALAPSCINGSHTAPPFPKPPPPTSQAPIPTRYADIATLAARVSDETVRDAPPALSPSVYWGAFESSMQRRWDGARLDMIASTRHDVFAEADYRRVLGVGMTACRDAARWPLLEARPGHFDASSLLPMVRAAGRVGVRVVWDLCHYGWPDGLDVYGREFVRHFAALGRRVAEILDAELGEVWISPINEISFLSWAAGERRLFYPYAAGRGGR